MKFSVSSLAVLATCASTSAFAPSNVNVNINVGSQSQLNAKNTFFQSIEEGVKGAAAATFLAGAIWASPAAMVSNDAISGSHLLNLNDNVRSSIVADAKEMASGSGSRVNKDAESLLRLGLPIPKDKDVRKFVVVAEEIKQDIGTKRKAAAIDGIKKTKSTLKSKSADFTKMCRDTNECTSIIADMTALLDPMDAAMKDAQNFFNGSDQERKVLDDAYAGYDKLQKLMTALEEQMVPKGFVTPVPSDYNDLPQLRGGRATVEFVLNKPDGGEFNVEGKLFPTAKMVMIIDGYTAPVTGGNFVELVDKGFYNNMKIQRSDGFVVQTGDPDGVAEGYTGGTPSKSVGKGKHGERLIPSEIFCKGDKGPFYETTIEDEGRGGEATVLPFSSFGAMGWARDEYDANSGSSQFFWLLFDSDLTPAGKNVLDGRYPVFGYVVEGADFLRDVKEDDIIVSAKVTAGIDKLVLPK
uniref:peptidylprolyl isomerase n=1 Tax=Chaetoceros debilis TaxID=122233 RepID=A0A7S3VDJ1_9STRA